MNAMLTIKKEFNCHVGYSDHSPGIIVPIIAVSLGAKVIEKHITLNKNMRGPDHKASIEPLEFKQMVDHIRLTEKILGSEKKTVSKSERKKY